MKNDPVKFVELVVIWSYIPMQFAIVRPTWIIRDRVPVICPAVSEVFVVAEQLWGNSTADNMTWLLQRYLLRRRDDNRCHCHDNHSDATSSVVVVRHQQLLVCYRLTQLGDHLRGVNHCARPAHCHLAVLVSWRCSHCSSTWMIQLNLSIRQTPSWHRRALYMYNIVADV